MQKILSFFQKSEISRKFLGFLRKKMLYYYCAGLNPPSAVDVGPAFFMLFVIGKQADFLEIGLSRQNAKTFRTSSISYTPLNYETLQILSVDSMHPVHNLPKLRSEFWWL